MDARNNKTVYQYGYPSTCETDAKRDEGGASRARVGIRVDAHLLAIGQQHSEDVVRLAEDLVERLVLITRSLPIGGSRMEERWEE